MACQRHSSHTSFHNGPCRFQIPLLNLTSPNLTSSTPPAPVQPVFHIHQGSTTENATVRHLQSIIRPEIPLFNNYSVELLIITWFCVVITISCFAILALSLVRLYYKKITQNEVDKIHNEFKNARVEYMDAGKKLRVLAPLSSPFTDPSHSMYATQENQAPPGAIIIMV